MDLDVFAVVDRPLSPDDIAARVDDPGAGGVVIFSGVVRNETGGRPVKFLEYEAHAPMAEAKLREIGAAIRGRWSGVKRVAVSGGADSVALLHLLHELAPAWRLTLHVLHVDHGLRPDSAADGRFVRELGERLGVPVDVERVHVGPGSVEAAARAARYAVLEA